MKLEDLDFFLNDNLKPLEFKDYCPNGLLVQGCSEITSGVAGVSLNLELIQQAISQKASFIFVHHPHDFWNNQSRALVGRVYEKVKLLIEHQISVFSYHLPLDAHRSWGNNAGLCQALSLNVVDHFAFEGKNPIGFIGELEQPLTRDEFLNLLTERVGKPNFVLPFGKEKIQRVALCSGSYPQGAEEVRVKGNIDLYLTGEIREQITYAMQEEKMNFVAAGHHQTERFGPKLTAKAIEKEFGIPVEFVDVWNPV